MLLPGKKYKHSQGILPLFVPSHSVRTARLLQADPSDHTIKLWDAATGKEIQTLTGHTSYVRSVAFSPDGKTIASGSWDQTIKLWDATTGKEIQTLSGHTDDVSSVAFSPDGKTIASGSDDTTIKLWDARLLWLSYDYPYTETDMEELLRKTEEAVGYRLNGITPEPITNSRLIEVDQFYKLMAIIRREDLLQVQNQLLFIDNINQIDSFGLTPLMLAAAIENKAIIEALLDAGADKKIKNADGKRAIDFTDNEEIRKLVD